MEAGALFNQLNGEFFTGVPDSLLRPICDYLMKEKGISASHVIAANEGNCVGLAAGYYLATGKTPVVYLQNSGIGNIANPVISLLNERVYGIPCLFLVGWRGEPGSKDEPQHSFQGMITHQLLNDMGIAAFTVRETTDQEELGEILEQVGLLLDKGKQAALVFTTKSIVNSEKQVYKNDFQLEREKAIHAILKWTGDDIIVASTGKISREVFEVREQRGERHEKDFLTVGSMGHSSSVALGIALAKPKRRIWCLDGDGALLMHMGALAVIGTSNVKNLVHIVFNNSAHESVGGLPTVMGRVNLCETAKSLGYSCAHRIDSKEGLEAVLEIVRGKRELAFIEVLTAMGSRADLGRPTISPEENKCGFMKYLEEDKE